MCDDGPSAGVLKQFIPSLIEPGLYLGSIASEQETEVLQSLGVTHVLSLTTGFSPTAPDVCRVKKSRPNLEWSDEMCDSTTLQRFQYEVIGMLDHAGISLFATMDTCLKHIDDGVRSGGVLVHWCVLFMAQAALMPMYLARARRELFDFHCSQAGVSRSAAVVIAHLISKHKWGFDEAFNFVKRKRPVIDPVGSITAMCHTIFLSCSIMCFFGRTMVSSSN
jgi:hypothetical protein